MLLVEEEKISLDILTISWPLHEFASQIHTTYVVQNQLETKNLFKGILAW